MSRQHCHRNLKWLTSDVYSLVICWQNPAWAFPVGMRSLYLCHLTSSWCFNWVKLLLQMLPPARRQPARFIHFIHGSKAFGGRSRNKGTVRVKTHTCHCMHTHTHIHTTHTYTNTHIYSYMHICYTYMHEHMDTHIQVYTHTYMHTHMHTHTHFLLWQHLNHSVTFHMYTNTHIFIHAYLLHIHA